MRRIAVSLLLVFAVANVSPAFMPVVHAAVSAGAVQNSAPAARYQHADMKGMHPCCPGMHQKVSAPVPRSMPCGDRHRCCIAQAPAAIPEMPVSSSSDRQVRFGVTTLFNVVADPVSLSQSRYPDQSPPDAASRAAFDVVLRN